MVPITVDTANRYLFVYTEISTNPKIKTFIQNRNFTQFRMDIKKITDFKPDTELRSENPFERTEIDRAKKRYDEPEAKKSKIVSSRTNYGRLHNIWLLVELLKTFNLFQNSIFRAGFDVLLLAVEFKTKPLVI